MSPRRRAAALAGLALVLGGLAASDVSSREAAIDRRLGPDVPVVVARTDLAAGRVLRATDLAVRRVPARYAPAAALASPDEAAGLRTTGAVVHGTDLVPALLAQSDADPATTLRPGERVAELVATGSPALVRAGGRVDVLVTRAGADGASGSTTLALAGAEVLSAAAAGSDGDSGQQRVAVSLRVTVRQAVYLAAAQSFARELRVLPRGAGDTGHQGQGLRVGSGL